MKRVTHSDGGKAHQEKRRLARPIREKVQEGEKRLRRIEEEKVACPVVTLQANFLWKLTFDTLYNNEFLIRVCSRTLSISSEHTTI